MADLDNLKLAYTIIQSLLQANEALSDLLVVASHSLDEETVKSITKTSEWEAYMESKRELDRTQIQLDELTKQLNAIEIAVEEG